MNLLLPDSTESIIFRERLYQLLADGFSSVIAHYTNLILYTSEGFALGSSSSQRQISGKRRCHEVS